MMLECGFFISFEGGEGSGKTTQIKRLAEGLRTEGFSVLRTREPGGTDGAEDIRALLLRGRGDRWTAHAEALLVSAARYEHVQRVIQPALERGMIVLCDRFCDSTLAYQGFGRGLDLDKLAQLHDWILGSFKPDLTFLLDVPADVGLARTNQRGGDEVRFESMERDFHHRLREGFLTLATAEPERFRVVDGQRSVDEIAREIRNLLGSVLSAAKVAPTPYTVPVGEGA